MASSFIYFFNLNIFFSGIQFVHWTLTDSKKNLEKEKKTKDVFILRGKYALINKEKKKGKFFYFIKVSL